VRSPNLPANAATSTIESNTNFFRRVRGGHMTATAHSPDIGRRTIVVHVEIRDDAGKSVALVIQTQTALDEVPATADSSTDAHGPAQH
jgi:uncharacterized protein (TIGR00369 family)